VVQGEKRRGQFEVLTRWSLAVRADNHLSYGTVSIDKLLHSKGLFEKRKDKKKKKSYLTTGRLS